MATGLPLSMSTSVLTTPASLFSNENKEQSGKERKDSLVRELSLKESKRKQRRSMAAPRKGRNDTGTSLSPTPPTRHAPTRTLSATAAAETENPDPVPKVLVSPKQPSVEGPGVGKSSFGSTRLPQTRSRGSMMDLFTQGSSSGVTSTTTTTTEKTPHSKSTHMATTIFGTISRNKKNSGMHKSALGLFDLENDISAKKLDEDRGSKPHSSPRLSVSRASSSPTNRNRSQSSSLSKSPRNSISGTFSKRFLLSPKKSVDDVQLKLKITGVKNEFEVGNIPKSGSLSARPILEHSQPSQLESDYDTKRQPQTARPRGSLPEIRMMKRRYLDQDDSKVTIFRVYLSEGRFTLNRNSIQGKTLLEVLEDIRHIIPFDMEGKIPRNRESSTLKLNTLVSELSTWEVLFGVTILNQLNDTELNPDFIQPKPSLEETPIVLTPTRTKQMEHAIMKDLSAKGTQLLDVVFPKNNSGEFTITASSKVIWDGNKTLRDILSHPLSLRQMKVEDLVPKDSAGNRLDWSKNLSELSLKDNTVVLVTTLEDSKPVKIYLPGGQVKEVNWDPTKELQQVLQALVEAKPELQNKEYKVLNASNNQPYLDLSIKLQDIGEPREICFGTTYKEWIEQQRILSIHMKKVQRRTKRSSLRTRSTSKTKLPKVIIDDPLKKPLGLPIVPAMPEDIYKAIYIYLPDGSIKTHPFEKIKELELGQVLDKLNFHRPELKDALANAEPLDQFARPLDRRTKLKDLGTIEVAFGITLEEWTLKERTDDIQRCLKQTGEVPENILKVYLPQGTLSSVHNDPKKHLGDVLRMLCVKRADLSADLIGAVPKDLFGNALDPNKTLGDLNVKEICYGVTILEWLEQCDKEKNKNNEDLDEDSLRTPRVKQRFGFLLQETPSITPKDIKGKDSARGTGDRKRDKTRSFSGSRSPQSKSRYRNSYRESTTHTPDYFSHYLPPTRTTVDEIQLASQLQSYWHMQNSHLSDEQLYRHYLEEEPRYQMTHMVPFRFLDVPATAGRGWDWEGNEAEGSDVEKGEGDVEKNFVEREDGEQLEAEFLDWVRNMEQAVASKREESQSGVVSVV